MRAGAPAAGRARLLARLAPWRRAAQCAAVLVAPCVGFAAAVVVLIASRHDMEPSGGAAHEANRAALLAAAAAGLCAAACAWLELRARGRGYLERLDERLGLEGALCAAVDGAHTRLSDALADCVHPRVSTRAMAAVLCARLWPALFLLCGSGVLWLASESWLARRADGRATPSASMAAVADDLQRAALDSRSTQVRARLAAAAAAARRLAVAEREAPEEDQAGARAELLAALAEVESVARLAQADEAARGAQAAARARSALEAGVPAQVAKAGQGGFDASGDGPSESSGRPRTSSAAGAAAGEAGAGSDALGSSPGLGAREGTGLASGASGGTISTPEPSRGELLAPTVLETLPMHEAGWLSEWAARTRAADPPPR